MWYILLSEVIFRAGEVVHIEVAAGSTIHVTWFSAIEDRESEEGPLIMNTKKSVITGPADRCPTMVVHQYLYMNTRMSLHWREITSLFATGYLSVGFNESNADPVLTPAP